ncbi:pre-peptidase C-terminal domain-containing protein [Plectonema cf. radiosum LEGE 06105]|uniref:Pre-peptidase C-terminal domain-containing protein n=1 Tax=Plectonema cf. radiosum LEGE 06105 TaxID=945769 RepID=A0A8J7JUP5_9CYAN|nr:pre-peptidase C-terminal domain-containing protein [Plectonema radiosum]MBE9215249.1 pre-peptidase C-terminal domain-containing protein [Plectonema cf. radiosum LEGE 06105]
MEPKISLQTLTGTFSGETNEFRDTILTPELVESLGEQPGASILVLSLQTEGEIPEGGVEVVINSDIALTDYFANLGRQPLTFGGEVLSAVYDEDGTATGIRLRVDNPNALISLPLENKEEVETDGIEQATFTLETGSGYSVDADSSSSLVTFYDSLETAPVPTNEPEVSMSVSETQLVESQGNTTTFTFNVEGEIPSDGLLVYVNSPGNRAALGEFDVFNAEVSGGTVPFPNFAASGFYFKILENGASITVPAFDETTNPEIEEGIVEGIQEFTFELVNGPGYTINSEAGAVNLTIADNPDSQIQVSYTVEPATLIESEATVGVHNFTLSATPPEEGLTVTVTADGLEKFDLSGIETTGISGDIEILESFPPQLRFTITDINASIKLPVANDGVDEGLESAVFTLQSGDGYQVNPEANSGTFNLVDTVEQVPPATEESEPNDILGFAQPVSLNEFNSEISINGSIDYSNSNTYENEDGTLTRVDASEDVDLYKVDLKAGDTIKIDADANQFEEGRKVDPWLRVFDANGAELASNDDGAAPNEIFDSGFEPYIEFTAPEDGSYYVGVSIYENSEYDPLTPASGTGNSELDPNEYGTGQYTINLSLNNPDAFKPEATEIPASTGEGIPISLFTVSGVYNNDFENGNYDILLGGSLVETAPEDTAASLNIVLTTEAEIPEGGLEVYVNSDIVLTDYFGDLEDEEFGRDYAVPYGGNLGGKPFSRGGQFLDAVYNEDGEATGFKFLLEESYGVISLLPSNREEAETDGAETATFSLVESEGYILTPANSSTVTFFDSLDDLVFPAVVPPEVSLELSTNELIESEGTELTLTLSLNQTPPGGGVQVYVSSGVSNFLSELDVFAADIEGGIVIPDGDVSGFYFQMFGETATITVPVFDSAALEAPEGIEQFDISLVPGQGYTVNPEQNGGTIIIKDTPDSLIQASINTEPEVLIESEATVANVNLSLSAPPPEEGVTLTVNAPEILEFDLESLTVTGGEIIVPPVASDLFGFTINLTEQDATVSFAVANDGEAETLETATFTVESGEGYQVDTEAASATFTIVDSPELAPSFTEEVNDTIDTAIATGLAASNTTTSFSGEINQYFVEVDEDNTLTVDATEDVDMYSFALNAGDSISIDVDSIPYELEGIERTQRLDSELRLLDAEGNELASVNNAPAPDEIFTANRDPYLEFTAETAGTYYVGVAQLGNTLYDPFEAGSGSGRTFPNSGINIGEYDISFNLTPSSEPEPEPQPVPPIFGSVEQNIIEVEGSNGLIFAGSSDDLIDASISSTGSNRIYAGSGDDTVILGMSDRIVGGAGDDKFFALSGGDNIITGGAGADQFWIATAEIPDAANVITDFTSGEDVLGIAGLGIGFDDLSITQQDDNTLIAANGSDLAILQGIGATSLIIDNFAFA